MSDIQFQGIVAVGNTKSQAVFEYKKLAMGKGATCFVDRESNSAFVSNSASDLENTFNPANGNMDLEQSTDILKGLQFEAQAGDVHDAYHFSCTAGCGIHLVYDSLSFVQHCPVCATAVASDDGDEGSADDEELDEEEIDGESDEDEIEDEEDGDEDEDEESLSSDEDDSDADADEEEESEEDTDSDDEDDADTDADDSEEDDAGDDEADDEGDADVNTADEPLVVAASSRDEAIAQYSKLRAKNMVATASSVVSVEYKVCACDEGCGAHIVSESSLEECPRPNCGQPLLEPVEASDEDELDLDDEDLGDDDSEDGDDEESDLPDDDEDLGDDEDDSEEDSEEDESDEVSMNLLPDDTSESSDEASDAQNTENTDGADTGTADTGTADTAAAENTDAGNADSQTQDDSQTSQSSDEDEDGDEVVVDALEELPEDAEVDDLDVSFSGSVAGQPIWTAYHKGAPVAVATASSINPDHKPFFGTPRFGAATIAAVKQGGIGLLNQLGYKGIKASLRVSKHVDTRLAAMASDQAAALQVANEQRDEAMEAALATAAIGLNRGFFAGKANPLRESLLQACASAGMRNPEVIVDNALRLGFEPMLREVFAIAKENLGKPADVQESLAKTIMGMNYQPQVATASSQSGFESRLGTLGTVATASAVEGHKPAATTAETAVAAAGSDDYRARIASAVAGLGTKR